MPDTPPPVPPPVPPSGNGGARRRKRSPDGERPPPVPPPTATGRQQRPATSDRRPPPRPTPGSGPRRPDRHDGPRHGPPWPPLDHPHNAGDPDEAFKPGFTMLDALAVLVGTLVIVVMFQVVVLLVGVDLESPRNLAVVQLAGQGIEVGLILTWMRLRNLAVWPLLGPLRPRLRHVWQGLGFGLIGVLLVLVVSELVASLLPSAQPPEQAMLQMLGQDLLVTAAVVASTVLLAPLVEEVKYRSLLFQSTRARIGLPGAMVLSSVVFAGAHVELWTSVPSLAALLVLALWLAGVFHQTGSLVVAIVAHATFNGLMVGLTLLPQELLGG